LFAWIACYIEWYFYVPKPILVLSCAYMPVQEHIFDANGCSTLVLFVIIEGPFAILFFMTANIICSDFCGVQSNGHFLTGFIALTIFRC
jgi:hypothetical protein